MLEYLNAAACFVLLAYCVPVAAVMETQHRWALWAIFVAVVVALAVQVIDPFASWVPAVGWPAVVLNVAMSIALTIWRKEAWMFMRCRLGPPESEIHPFRRVSDMRDLDFGDAMRVRGQGLK